METTANNILKLGMVLNDKWIILEFIGKGGMGEVYRAHQLNLKRDVAIKVVSQEWLESLDGDEEEIETGLQRFRREVEAMAQLRHPNILEVYDYGSVSIQKGDEETNIEYIAMGFVPGGTLRSTMSEDGFYPEEGLTMDWLHNYFLPVLDGVEALHEAGIIHRDLKPENILMDGKIPKIADFGLARSSRSKPVTRSIDMKGSPAYMSPEHFLDFRRADKRSDIYSLGKILFEAIEGKVSSATIPMKRASLSKTKTLFFQKLDRIIQDATVEEKDKRLSSVKELHSLLIEAIGNSRNKPTQAVLESSGKLSAFSHRKWIWGSLAVATVLAASLLAFNLNHLRAERIEHKASQSQSVLNERP
ncbi:MAG: serine/threonine protein kinase, partial [Deltaproteobacteria bacterium]|nr:serine/threonine protein kinase [Deltaproteobacteria bacterium]